MTWLRFEPGFSRHPKRVKSGPSSSWLWVCGLDHAAEYHTNGFIDGAVIATLNHGLSRRALRRAVAVLEEVGSWERVKGGWQIHGFLEHQQSAEQVAAERQAARIRYNRWRAHQTASSSNAVGNAVTTPLQRHSQHVSNDSICLSVSQSVLNPPISPHGETAVCAAHGQPAASCPSCAEDARRWQARRGNPDPMADSSDRAVEGFRGARSLAEIVAEMRLVERRSSPA